MARGTASLSRYESAWTQPSTAFLAKLMTLLLHSVLFLKLQVSSARVSVVILTNELAAIRKFPDYEASTALFSPLATVLLYT